MYLSNCGGLSAEPPHLNTVKTSQYRNPINEVLKIGLAEVATISHFVFPLEGHLCSMSAKSRYRIEYTSKG